MKKLYINELVEDKINFTINHMKKYEINNILISKSEDKREVKISEFKDFIRRIVDTYKNERKDFDYNVKETNENILINIKKTKEI